jgi:PQQ-dependent catabolism-associated CXXCW motif protein
MITFVALLGHARAEALRFAEPYLTSRHAPMFERPDRGAPVTDDIAPVRTVWGSPTPDGQWIGIVHGPDERIDTRKALMRPCTGLRRVQLNADGTESSWSEPAPKVELVTFEGGRIVAPDAVRACSRIKGYVLREHLLAADQLPRSPAHPIDLSAFGEPVPSLWGDLGVIDPRFWVLKPDRHPFNAVALVINTDGKGAVTSGGCAGFFVGPRIVVTASHCGPRPGEKPKIYVLRGRDRQILDAGVVADGGTGEVRIGGKGWGYDWLVLKTSGNSRFRIEPLSFVRSLPSDAALFDTLVVGFPGDLTELGLRTFGYTVPVATPCRIAATELFVLTGDRWPSGEAVLAVEPQPRHCLSWRGNSGGPMLVWNPASSRYEVAAFASFVPSRILVAREKYDEHAKSVPKFLTAAQTDVTRVASRINRQLQAGLATDTIRDVLNSEIFPGIAALNTTIFGGEAESYLYGRDKRSGFISSRSLMAALAAAGVSPAPALPPLDSNVFLRTRASRSPRLDGLKIWRECTQRCPVMEPLSQAAFQFKGSVGDTVSLAEYGRAPHAVVLHGRGYSDRKDPTSVVILGGDLLAIDAASERVVAIWREFWTFGRLSLAEIALEPDPKTRNRDLIDAYVSPKLDGVHDTLRAGDYGATTPATIPGGTVLGSGSLAKLLAERVRGRNMVVIAAIAEKWGLPGAVKLPFAGAGGSFDDAISQRLGEALHTLTDGARDTPIVFYCHHAQCWLSFNAALRAIKLGYTNVIWYRYGLDRWMFHRFPLELVKTL